MRYRLQRHDGTDCSATMVPITVLRMVPIQRYRQINCFLGEIHYMCMIQLHVSWFPIIRRLILFWICLIRNIGWTIIYFLLQITLCFL